MTFFAFIQYIHKLGDCRLAVFDADVVYFLVGVLFFGLSLLVLLLVALPLQGLDILFFFCHFLLSFSQLRSTVPLFTIQANDFWI